MKEREINGFEFILKMSVSLLSENDQRGLKMLDWSLGHEAQKYKLGNL